MSSKIILGIDPGYGRTGYGVVARERGKFVCLDYGVITTSADMDFSCRLHELYLDLRKLIKKHHPDLIAVEDLFFYKNLKTAIKVGEARGVVLLTAIMAGVPIVEYTPLQVKQAISSYGRAEKKQVQEMVKIFLSLKSLPQPDDAADALAIAICAGNSTAVGK